jgi:hypothetical protein
MSPKNITFEVGTTGGFRNILLSVATTAAQQKKRDPKATLFFYN